MKRFIEGECRAQSTLLPERLDDWITEDNPVRALDAFVDELDLAKLGFEGAEPCAPQILHLGRTDPVAGSSPNGGVIAPARMFVPSLADLAGLVVPSATPPTRHRVGERLGMRVGSLPGGLHHEHLSAHA